MRSGCHFCSLFFVENIFQVGLPWPKDHIFFHYKPDIALGDAFRARFIPWFVVYPAQTTPHSRLHVCPPPLYQKLKSKIPNQYHWRYTKINTFTEKTVQSHFCFTWSFYRRQPSHQRPGFFIFIFFFFIQQLLHIHTTQTTHVIFKRYAYSILKITRSALCIF